MTHRKVFLVLAHNKKRKVLRKRKESPPKKAIHNVKKNIQISMKKKARKNYHNEPSPEWTNKQTSSSSSSFLPFIKIYTRQSRDCILFIYFLFLSPPLFGVIYVQDFYLYFILARFSFSLFFFCTDKYVSFCWRPTTSPPPWLIFYSWITVAMC